MRTKGGDEKHASYSQFIIGEANLKVLCPPPCAAQDFGEAENTESSVPEPSCPLTSLSYSLDVLGCLPAMQSWWTLAPKDHTYHFFCSRMRVILGAHNIRREERTQQHLSVLRAIRHPRYDPQNNLNDIMLLQVSPA